MDREQVSKIAELIKKIGNIDPGLNFYSYGGVYAADSFPSLGHPRAIDFFFATTLQNHGFWLERGDGSYNRPLTGKINGKEGVKGSELMDKAAMRAFTRDPDWCDPLRLAVMSRKEFDGVFSDDNGPIPFQDCYERLRKMRQFGTWFAMNRMTPVRIVEEANKNPRSLQAFLDAVCEVPGFSEDPLRKKASLLAMALENRPEKFLQVHDSQNRLPIIDYHVMRVLLRLGVIALSPEEAKKNITRAPVARSEEASIRLAAFEANNLLIRESGRSMPEVDFLLWSARRYCPEMTTPQCNQCVFNPVCERRVELFQPVYRTFFY